jgi:leucyl aminopeptidase (aminopeptidase T)
MRRHEEVTLLHLAPPDLAPGARNAIRTCLRVRPDELVSLITDRHTEPIAASLADEVRAVGAPVEVYLLEDYGPRPTASMPAPILAALERADVSIFAAQPQPGELASRIEMTRVIERRQIRHAHMVSITPQIMAEGMCADFDAVDDLSVRVLARASTARTITARSRAGSDLTAQFDPRIKWVKTSGIISHKNWANLPGGEVFTTPARVDGVYVADGALGDFLGARYGDIEATPLRVTLADGRIVAADCARDDILADFLAYTSQAENADRVGELAIGTNIGIRSIIGNMLQDEKIPGLHIAFGHGYAEQTGADWTGTTHLDIVGRAFDIWIDDEQIMADGAFVI